MLYLQISILSVFSSSKINAYHFSHIAYPKSHIPHLISPIPFSNPNLKSEIKNLNSFHTFASSPFR